jgi:hypothetical protein
MSLINGLNKHSFIKQPHNQYPTQHKKEPKTPTKPTTIKRNKKNRPFKKNINRIKNIKK